MDQSALRSFLKTYVFRLPGLDWLNLVRSLTSAGGRDELKHEIRSLRQWSNQARRLFANPLHEPEAGKTALFFGQTRVDFVMLESFMIKAFELAGYRPVVITVPSCPVRQAYRVEGVSENHIMQGFFPPPNHVEAARLMTQARTFDDLIKLEYRGIRVGKYVASTLMRKWRQGSIPLDNRQVGRVILERLADSVSFADGALAMIDRFKPSATVFVDRGYSPAGELIDASINAGIPAYSWCAAHRNNAFMLKKYNRDTRDVHPSSLSPESWHQLQQMPWTPQRAEEVRQELSWCYSSGEWYSEVGTQVNKQNLENQTLRQKIGIDSNKPVATIFSHIFWDATFFWGIDLFRDYEDWFVQTVQAACRNDRLHWLVKVHPANVVKDHRDGVKSVPSEVKALQEKVGKLPPHVTVLPADWNISTYSLFQIMDYCLTVRGTVGIEAALLGKRVLTAGTGRYDRLGFTHDFSSAREYLEALTRLHEIPLPDAREIELAQRYAYGVFLGRPLPLSSIRMEYQKDARATLAVGWKLDSPDALKTSPDLRAAADWIRSGADDHLRLPESF